jgi:hypothetical protein
MKLKYSVMQKHLACLVAVLVCCIAADGQGTNKLEEQFNQYGSKVLQEKVFMHTDRNFYVAGDIIWFKLYNVDASFHRALGMSKVAYIEILDAENNPVLQAKVSLANGKGNGSVSLPVKMQSGNYKLRAYTNWMKNFGADYFFEKPIAIVNTKIKRDIPEAAKPLPPDLRLFPEGGNLVTGINSKIACKVTGSEGKGLDFEGSIVDDQNNSVVSFGSLEHGMGNFSFTPQPNRRYKAIVKTTKGTVEKEFPEIYKEGYVMRVNDNDKQLLQVQVETNITTEGETYLLVHTRNSLKSVMKASLRNGQASFTVDKNKLGDGISGLTVFNTARQPVCERLYFKYPENELKIRISAKNTQYPARSKIDIDILATDENNIRQKADMSMSVYRLDEMQQLDENNINTYLWLVSDLKGYIESPTYYFENVNARVTQAMDNLMLTQGWRRFKWEDILQDKTPSFTYVPEFNGHMVTGKVVNTITGAPMKEVEVYASAPGRGTNFLTSVSDGSGKVKFDFTKILGTSELVVQTSPTADSMARVEITNPFYESYTANKLPTFRLSKANQETLLDHSIGMQVQNIYTGDLLQKQLTQADTIPFFKKPDATYFLDDYERFTTMEEVMREYVAFMDVIKKNDRFSFNLLDLSADNTKEMHYFTMDPLMLVDGVPVSDVNKLMSFDPLKMRKLEVVNRRYFLGHSYFLGMMNWETYKGNTDGYELDPRATILDYEGLQLEREFYSPVYDTDEKLASHLPDFRNLLYWTPSLVTNEKGEQQAHFYSSDKKGKYIAIVQGLGVNGLPGTGLMQFEVK